MRSELQKYFGDKPFWKAVLAIAVPIAIQSLLSNSFSMVDTLMVGQLGDISLSGSGMAGQWSFIMNIILSGISSGMGIFAAQYWGVNDRKNIRRSYGVSMFLTVSFSLFFFLTGLCCPRLILRLFTKETAVIEEGARYLRIVCFSYPAIGIAGIAATLLRSTECVKVPMYSSFLSTVVNCAANYVLIFGKLGLPVMGIRGAALATDISAWIGVLFIFWLSHRQNNLLYGHFSELRFDAAYLKVFLKTAVPVSAGLAVWGFGTVAYNVIFGHLGYENYAAITIMTTFQNSISFFISGIGAACCVLVGKSIGAGLIEKGYADARRFAVIMPAGSLICGLLLIPFRTVMVRLFNLSGNMTAYTLHMASTLLLIVGLEIVIRYVSFIDVTGIFQSGGDAVAGLWINGISLWFVALPLTAIAAFWLKLPFAAVYTVMLLGEDIPKTILCTRHLVSRKWIKPVTEQGKQAINS